ncbi:MAG: MG2 domain-containing protein, partial [Bacteroidota bacterium]
KARQDLNGLITIDGGQQLRHRLDGNVLYAYVDAGASGSSTVKIAQSIQNAAGNSLGRDVNWQVSFTRPDPELRTVGQGTIMPHAGSRLFPFEAIGLEAVHVEIFKIFENNVLQFLQDNQLGSTSDTWSLHRVGRIISQERVLLSELAGGTDLDSWTRYAIDLSKYLEQDERAIYQVRIGFGMDDVRRQCSQRPEDFGVSIAYEKEEETIVGFEPAKRSIIGDYYGIYGQRYDNFDWEDRDDVCKPAYYHGGRFLTQNVISSNLGLIAKQHDDRRTMVFVTDLLSGKPVSGAEVIFYDYQQQQLARAESDANGRVEVTTDFQPAFVAATEGQDVGYLKLDYSTGLSTSRFDVSGVAAVGGVKGTFYAERGVWRPGDSVYLNFVLEDRLLKLPPDYPLSFELYDSQGRLRDKRTARPAAGDIYPLYFTTQPDDPTGNWRASVKIGGQQYAKTLKIETVKPNRLKIDLNFNDRPLSPTNRNIGLTAAWLHGAPADGMEADVEMQLRRANKKYDKFPNFVFYDPARRIYGNNTTKVFDGTLNASGQANFEIPNQGKSLPGPMSASFKTRVFEPGGNFSVDNIRTDYVPFSHLAGVRLPENRWGGHELIVDQEGQLEFAAITPEGEPAAGRKLDVGVYRIEWRYWWQDNNDNVSRYSSSRHERAIKTETVTVDRQGVAKMGFTVPQWGRYLVRACDPESGHCAGDYFYAGSPDYAEMDRNAASLLQLRTDKENYEIGETVTLSVPASEGGMILLSLENSEGVLQTEWRSAKAGDNTLTFKTDERMLPSVYANVMLIQPHGQTINDRPIRMYGIVPIRVEDPTTRLQPVVATNDEWEPEQRVQVTVKEDQGREMNYTLAVVDEGLLGLTRFATPDLWEAFFAREALTVQTFDLFNQVIGSLDGQFSRVLAIGGDGELAPGGEQQRANRFMPVVRHLGPFTLPAGRQVTHNLTLPNYVGAVRVMVVAQGDRAYGSTEKTVPVRKPLMVLPTLPRVIGPGESLAMPVNVFAMTDKVKEAKVTVRETSGLVNFTGANSQSTRFVQPGDKLMRFPMQVGNKLGVARFEVVAEGNGERVSQEIEIDVRNPNSYQTEVTTAVLQPGETKVIGYTPFGSEGTRAALLEMGGLPPLNLDRHLRYLLSYPYGCVEQTVSPAFAQLHLAKLVKLSTEQEERARMNVDAAINRLVRFQAGNGALSYWPGQSRAQPWASNYALHFLLEAEAAGYTLPLDLKDRLINFQKSAAANWRSVVWDYYTSDGQRQLDQAYRLYTLALAQQPDLGAMNRLRGISGLSPAAAYRLAAAYALAGKQSTAEQLYSGLPGTITPYRELSYTFGSEIRDMAMILE